MLGLKNMDVEEVNTRSYVIKRKEEQLEFVKMSFPAVDFIANGKKWLKFSNVEAVGELFLTGSRYYGTAMNDSDWDYFGGSNTCGVYCWWLVNNGWDITPAPYHRGFYLHKGDITINIICLNLMHILKWKMATLAVAAVVKHTHIKKQLYVSMFQSTLNNFRDCDMDTLRCQTDNFKKFIKYNNNTGNYDEVKPSDTISSWPTLDQLALLQMGLK